MSKPLLKSFPCNGNLSCPPPCGSEISADRRERELDRIAGIAKAKTMPVAFAALVKFLSQAIQEDCAWLDDFADDTIHIDADLYDVLLSYQQLQQHRSAA